MMEFESVTLFEISTLELIKIESFMQLKNSLTLEPKMPFMGIFGITFGKLSYYSKSPPRIFQNGNYPTEKRKNEFGTKNT